LLNLTLCICEREQCFFFFSSPPSNDTFPVGSRKFDAVVDIALSRIRRQGARDCFRRSLAQRIVDVFDVISLRWIFFRQGGAQLLERPQISPPVRRNPRPQDKSREIVWNNSERAIQCAELISVAMLQLIGQGE